MIVSVNWLKKFTSITTPIDELAVLIGSRLVEIEEVIDLGKKYNGVVVAKVVECARLEGSDHLNVAKIDDGGVVKSVERDENGLVQVVCGAPNVRTGILVAWLAPGVTLPATVNDPKPVVLEARALRGTMSNGMLASPKELGIGEAHEGILEIDKTVAPGTDFASVYELDDYLLDIENKSLTHRPDTFGIIGFARELAAIQDIKFETPKVLHSAEPEWVETSGDIETPKVTIDDPELSQRYQAVVLTNIDAKKQSPIETQTYLSRIGMRPISAAVDVTNYLMMLTGQPLHAFDYDKLKAVNNGIVDIHVRAGREGEKLLLLDGRDIELSTNDIVIANGDTAVALAGAMGGASTEVDENTTSILLESATFNLYNLRNTQMRHGIFSEAITRFTKGQPAALTAPVLAEAVRLFAMSTGAVKSSEVADCYPGQSQAKAVEVATQKVNDALGSDFAAEQMAATLQNVECQVENVNETIRVTPPYWRTDIKIPEDVIEEIGRLNGFDAIEPRLPKRDFTAVAPTSFDVMRAKIRSTLARAGANEVLNYSFVHGNLLQKAGQNPVNSYRLTNSISPDLQYYRQTLTPSLLSGVHANIKAGYDAFALFELNKVHQKSFGMNEENVPKEHDNLAVTIADRKTTGAAFYQAKTLLNYLAATFGISLAYEPFPSAPGTPESAPFEYKRSAAVIDQVSGQRVGIIGEYAQAVKKAFKLPDYAAGFELDIRELAIATQQAGVSYTPLSRYPATDRDICFKVAKDTPYQALLSEVQQVLRDINLETVITPLDIYAEPDSSTKNITLRIRLVSHQKTLTSEEVASVVNGIAAKTASIGATII